MRSKLVVAAIVTAVVATWATIAIGVGKRVPISDPVVLHFKAERFVSHVVDIFPAGQSLGDSSTRTSVLTDNGKEIGHMGQSCIQTNNEPVEIVCDAVLKLDGGTVSLQTMYLRDKATAGVTLKSAVAGGTGIYLNVTGEAEWTRVSDQIVRYKLTLNP